MILRLAYQNTLRSLPKRWPIVVVLAFSIAVLFIGNTILENTDTGMKRTYVQSLAGDFSVSATSVDSFTLFGSDLPLIGEYKVLPALPGAQQWLDKASHLPGSAGALGQVTAAAGIALGNYKAASGVFGVDFEPYFAFFPALRVVKGSIPRPGDHALLVNEAQFEAMTQALGQEPALGSPVTLTVFNDTSFTIREVKLAGVYRYPVRDELLNRVVLADADTARALNGYVYGIEKAADAPASKGTSASDLEALFGEATDLGSATEKGVDPAQIERDLADHTLRDQLNTSVGGSWNFVLVKSAPGQEVALHQGLVQSAANSDVLVREWRDTVGGNALLVWLVSWMFNAGLGFVTAAAAFIVINSLALSVAERTKEIGTMRALGAQRLRVAGQISLEVVLLVAGAGFVGVALGWLLLVWLGPVGIPLENPYLKALFGTSRLHPSATLATALGHALFSIALGLVAVVYPVRMALKILPVQAMARE
jgi:putative ABC transport system permease protein